MREGRARERAAYLALAGSLTVAAGSRVEAVRGATPPRVGLLIGGALALCLAGMVLEVSGRTAAMPALTSLPSGHGWPGRSPDEVLRRYPRATLRWLRGRLRLSPEAFAAHLGTSSETVAGWEALGRAIPLDHQRRILPLLTRHLATPEGEAFIQSLRHGATTAAEGGT